VTTSNLYRRGWTEQASSELENLLINNTLDEVIEHFERHLKMWALLYVYMTDNEARIYREALALKREHTQVES
jgi:hypothetical protein